GGRPVWIRDLQREEGLRPLAAARAGLGAAVACPVSSGSAAGVLALYSRDPEDPDEALVRMVETLGRQIGGFLERLRAEQRLRESEEKFRRIFHEGVDGITLNALEVGTYLDVNREFLALTGYRRDEVVGKTPADLRIWTRKQDLKTVLSEIGRKGFIRNLETEFRMKDGGTIHGLYSAMHMEVGGRPCVLSFVRDVGDFRRAERELEASRQQLALSEKLSALGSLVSGVAHEIRTPTAYIANNLFLLRHRLEESARSHPELEAVLRDVSQYCSVAEEGVGRIDRLVKDLRRFGRQNLEGRVDASLHGVVEVAVNIFRAVQRGRIRIEMDLRPTAAVHVDPQQIQQVVLNLLNNAAEAMNDDGVIQVATRPAAHGGEIEVQDRGPGLTEEIQARLFDPFFTTKADGTGLGLSIVRRIVDAHGGTIRYETRREEGTRFIVYLPEGAPPSEARS
ncbi:MAG: ATP-binding protein, partial [Candidatus Binatia bacterium]